MSYPPQTRALAASGTDSIAHERLPTARTHHIHVTGSGTVQCDLYVANQALPAQTVSVSSGSPVIVDLPNVTNIELTETTTTDSATVTSSGRD